MAGNPIEVNTANGMKNDYLEYMIGLGVDMDDQTQSVSFTPEIVEWMNDVMQYADELKVYMARYMDNQDHAGRTTVVIWPYLNGNPAEWPSESGKQGLIKPYNDGTGTP